MKIDDTKGEIGSMKIFRIYTDYKSRDCLVRNVGSLCVTSKTVHVSSVDQASYLFSFI